VAFSLDGLEKLATYGVSAGASASGAATGSGYASRMLFSAPVACCRAARDGTRDGTEITLDEVRGAMGGVARFKLPERLELVGELPVTKVGKIDKKALRAQLGES